MERLKAMVASYQDGNFLLILAGTDLEEPDKPTTVIEILGSHHSSTFKSLNIEWTAQSFMEPRITRNAEPLGNDMGAPSMNEFLGCKQ
jgi:hypothetical protein